MKSSLLIATAFGAVPGAKHGRESRADALVDARAGGNVSVQAALGCNGFWLTVTFVISGLLAAPNGTLIATMLISALSASGAILLILGDVHPVRRIDSPPSHPILINCC